MRIKVFFSGDLSYKGIINKLLENSITIEETFNLKEADLIYCVYGRGPSLNFTNRKLWFSKQKLIVHWIGTDVLTHVNKLTKNKNLRSLYYHKLWNKIIKIKTENKSMLNLCCAPWLCEELNQVGVKSTYVPLTTINQDLLLFEEEPRYYDFMSYLPQNRSELYNAEEVLKLARILNKRSFLIIVPDVSNISELKYLNVPSNTKIITRVSHEETIKLYRKSKFFLRFTEHDGLSLSVIESIASKSHVYWTYPFHNTFHIKLPLTNEQMSDMDKQVELWKPNNEGYEYISRELKIDKIQNEFKNTFTSFYFNYGEQ